MSPNAFKCPECGCTQPESMMLVSTVFREDDAWSAILSRYTCSQCKFTIPADLAERWDGISYEDAVKEWHAEYRATSPASGT